MRVELLLVVAMAVAAGCSSFESSPGVVDAGTPVEHAGVEAETPIDASGPAPRDAGADAGTEQVYAWGFETEDWGRVAADVASASGRTAKALLFRGTSSGVYSAVSGKRIAVRGAGKYRVRVWIRHERDDGAPTLSATLKTAYYASIASNVVGGETEEAPVPVTGTWTELTGILELPYNAAIPVVTVTVTAASSGMRGAFLLDDLTIERLP